MYYPVLFILYCRTSKSSNRKEKIKKPWLRSQLGLNVDQRREGGFGNTNTGNVARKAFANAVITAQICGVSPMLISNLETIHRALAMDKDINTEEFEKFCNETLEIYFSEAGWYNIPPTLHKILVHGKEIIEAMPIAIGITSEEGSESNIKFARQFYKHHTRKNCHKNTMFDLFHRLMDVSDPVILSKQCVPTQTSTRLIPVDLLKLIQNDEENQKLERPELSESSHDLSVVSQKEVSVCSDDSIDISFDLSILNESL